MFVNSNCSGEIIKKKAIKIKYLRVKKKGKIWGRWGKKKGKNIIKKSRSDLVMEEIKIYKKGGKIRIKN